MISFSTFLLTSQFIKPILGAGNLRDLKTLRYTLFDIDKCWISSVSTSKMKAFFQRVLFRNALKSLKYENGSNFLKKQYFSLNLEIDFMFMTEVWLNENFSLLSFFQNEKLPLVSMKQDIMTLVLEILKFDNTQSYPKFRWKLYSYHYP